MKPPIESLFEIEKADDGLSFKGLNEAEQHYSDKEIVEYLTKVSWQDFLGRSA